MPIHARFPVPDSTFAVMLNTMSAPSGNQVTTYEHPAPLQLVKQFLDVEHRLSDIKSLKTYLKRN